MFEINKEEIAKRKAENEAGRKLAELLSDLLLSSEHTPEGLKLTIKVMNAHNSLGRCIKELSDKCVRMNPENLSDRDVETIKKVIEYLGMVETGVRQFAEQISMDAEEDMDV